MLNAATVLDNYPLPRVDDILADFGHVKYWGKINMTNSFFQTLVHPDDIKYMATLTPFGLWEWVVMPMGLWNSPATHQRRVTLALKDYIGKICHVYLDDIIIWSNSLEEHEENCQLILRAL
jgi:Reverse transcriptase (RNA-dependent DNA polymerase).